MLKHGGSKKVIQPMKGGTPTNSTLFNKERTFDVS